MESPLDADKRVRKKISFDGVLKGVWGKGNYKSLRTVLQVVNKEETGIHETLVFGFYRD